MIELADLTPEQFFKLDRIGDPQISPDGRQVAYVVQHADRKKMTWKSQIWLVPADGSEEPRRLTTSGTKNQSPRWAPDGHRIAFLSNRAGRTHIWLLDLNGGEAMQVSSGEPEPLDLVWSPDGTRLVFSAWTPFHDRNRVPYPGAPLLPSDWDPAESETPRVIARYDHKKDGDGLYGDRFRQLYLCRVGNGPSKPDRLAILEANCERASWSPDGRQIAFVVSGADDRHFFAGSDLWLLDLDLGNGAARRLWHPGGYCSSRPAWSPDGAKIGIVADDAAAGAYTTTDGVWEVDVASGSAANLTTGFSGEVGDPVSSDWRLSGDTGPTWTEEGWLFLARSQGQSHIYRTPRTPLTAGPMAVGGYSYAAGRLACQSSTPSQPDCIYVDSRLLVKPGGAWAGVNLQPARRFSFTGQDGLPMEGWVILPAGPGPHPAVLSIHGGPHNVYGEAFTLQFQFLAAAGYAVVYLNPRGSQSYSQEFTAAVCGDWGGADYEDLMLGLDAAVSLGGIDEDRLGVTGWSYGGYMTNTIVTRTDRFKAAVSGASIANLHSFYGTSDIGRPFLTVQAPGLPWAEPEQLLSRSPLQGVAGVKTPVLLLHGEHDLRCPITQSEEFYLALKALGKTAVLVRYPGEPHSFRQPAHIYDRHRRTIAWFDYYVRGV